MTSRVLLVEDDDQTREQLKLLIEELLLGCCVSTASSVSGGRKAIEHAVEDSVPFDAAVLDIKLPPEVGDAPEIDETLCREFQTRMPDGLVFHITGFSQDPVVQEHIQRDPPPDRPRGFVFDKGEGFPDNLLDTLRRYICNTKIKQAIWQLFVPQPGAPAPPGAYARFGGYPSRRSTTSQLVDLCVEISQYWPYLDETTRDLVCRHLQVDESSSPVMVTLA